MRGEQNHAVIILLMERGGDDKDVGKWLADSGFVAWKAKDVGHAIEELSDFTVRRRPDVVMLEVERLAKRFDALTNAFHECAADVSVCGYSQQYWPGSPLFTANIDRLKSMIALQVRPSNV